jgi:hypothetical protein
VLAVDAELEDVPLVAPLPLGLAAQDSFRLLPLQRWQILMLRRLDLLGILSAVATIHNIWPIRLQRMEVVEIVPVFTVVLGI